ncbi:MAG: TolC family protein [Tannerella sp.]|jgi:cobalt-zinc-cadmium efflux system outer membrane protein|nr:TolC family protein [Tannerella sp.]
MEHIFINRQLSFNMHHILFVARYLSFVIVLLYICQSINSQEPERMQQPIDYKTYMDRVWRQNLGYAAERLNPDIAEAGIKAAKVFNDPSLSVEYADNDDRRLKMGRSVSVELSKTFSAGKRSANIELAQSEKDLNEALLEDYFHRLRAEATLTYLEAVKQSELYYLKENTCSNIHRLAAGDSIRFALGKITQVDAVQSKVEAEIASGELARARTELYNVYASLGLWTGVFDRDVLYLPSERLPMREERSFDSGKLLQAALENRADLAAAMKNVEVARKALKVTQRERNIDFDIVLGYNYNTEVRNEIAPAPRFNGVTAGISIPLKFSSTNKAAVQAAGFRKRQAELNYRQAELEVQTSVMQSLRLYRSSLEQVKRYEDGLLDDARSVLEGKIYSYERGETSRLEVLVAQQTYNELRTAYIETLFGSIAALVELERSVGIWDIEL